MKVLIVDDEVSFRSLLRDCLVDEGFEVHLADSGEEGMQKLQEETVDIVVSDLRMHVMDGITFCKTARSLPEFSAMPFIFVSAYGDTQTIAQVNALGNSAFLSKGHPPNELIELIHQLGKPNGVAEAPVGAVPAQAAPPEPPRPRPVPERVKEDRPPVGEHPRVLVVDDDDALRLILTDILFKEGFVVTAAADGQEAIDLLGKHVFDLVLLDILMPNVSGYGVLSFMKEHVQSTRVIMLTAYTELKLAVECKELGADDFIGKPFMRGDLLNTIRQVLKQ